ncbi:MAG: P1 family peptidase [Actinomycetota bacterium]
MITDVPGVTVGHYTDTEGCTGCTAILVPPGTVGGYTLAGAAPGTRETDMLGPQTIENVVHAFVLSGGSAFGLASADGVVSVLEERGIGFEFGGMYVPLVPAAVIFDLPLGDPKARPGAEHGRAAALSATTKVDEGSVGAGTGATCGKYAGIEGRMKGGLGTASARVEGTDAIVGALVVCNAVGDVVDERGEVIAGSRIKDPAKIDPNLAGQSTVLASVMTNAILDKGRAVHVAKMAGAGIARAVRPAFTFFDGDIIFCGATQAVDCEPNLVGMAAAEVVAEALRRGVRAAKGLGGAPGLAD